MPSESWLRVKDLFQEALEIDPDERVGFLADAYAETPAIKEEVDTLFALHEEAGAFLDEPSLPSRDRSERSVAVRPSGGAVSETRIGPYRVLQEIGHGGMGVVYEAEQEKPVRRKVALKLIKWGMDTNSVLARFHSERQALALMNHRNIASVYDAGATNDGRPYFAMELVSGVPITEFCDTYRLDTVGRLRLFTEVCQGIQHAHHKGIIHRDIKPSNVLVTLQDETPVPKIIDFGVAKATSQRLTDKTLYTEIGQMIGTPEYMSPEQAEMSGLDIDSRTDVYSLGAVLYQLLTGVQPFDTKDLRSLAFEEIRRTIREDDPIVPSQRAKALPASELASVSQKRRSDPKSLVTELRGDLDWITMKAMDKDRTRRYASASEMASDVTRHLRDEVVTAAAPRASYRAKKFIRRHRVGVAATALVFVSLLATVALTGMALVRATRAEKGARDEARRATAVTNFLKDMLGSADPRQSGRDVKVVDVLDQASAKVAANFESEPILEASVRETLGGTLIALGQYDLAVEHFDTVYRIRRAELGLGHPSTLQSISDLAAVAYYTGDLERAVELARRAVEAASESLGATDELTIEASSNLGVYLNQLGKIDESERVYRATYESARVRYGETHHVTLTVANNLAVGLKTLGRVDEAEKLYRDILRVRTEAFGTEHPDTLNGMHNLAILLDEQGKPDESEALHRQALEMKRRVLGEGHPKTLSSMHGLALALTSQNKCDEAIGVYLELFDLLAGGAEAGWVIQKYRKHYGMCLAQTGNPAEAESELLAAFEGLHESLGLPHHETQNALIELIRFYEGRENESTAAHYRTMLAESE